MPESGNPRDLPTPTALHILLALGRAPMHGSAIRRDVEERTEGTIVLGPGTLYEAIHRMEADGWIAEVPDQPGRRRVYRITDAGRSVLADEVARLDAIVRFARSEDLYSEARDG